MTTAETGAAGERAAAEYLRKAGYRLLERNWRRGNYELDLVVTDGEVLHIVEVKTRHAGALTPPEAAATRRKFRALTRAAAAYLRETGWTGEVQFDVAAVEVAADGTMQVGWIGRAWGYKWEFCFYDKICYLF